MGRSIVAAALMSACLSVGSARAAETRQPCSPAPARKAARASHATLSAKGSTPVGSVDSDALSPRRGTVRSNTPKSSTPIAGTTAKDRPRSGGALTPKGSLPVSGEFALAGCIQ